MFYMEARGEALLRKLFRCFIRFTKMLEEMHVKTQPEEIEMNELDYVYIDVNHIDELP